MHRGRKRVLWLLLRLHVGLLKERGRNHRLLRQYLGCPQNMSFTVITRYNKQGIYYIIINDHSGKIPPEFC